MALQAGVVAVHAGRRPDAFGPLARSAAGRPPSCASCGTRSRTACAARRRASLKHGESIRPLYSRPETRTMPSDQNESPDERRIALQERPHRRRVEVPRRLQRRSASSSSSSPGDTAAPPALAWRSAGAIVELPDAVALAADLRRQPRSQARRLHDRRVGDRQSGGASSGAAGCGSPATCSSLGP